MERAGTFSQVSIVGRINLGFNIHPTPSQLEFQLEDVTRLIADHPDFYLQRNQGITVFPAFYGRSNSSEDLST